jgi:hypothetical protein
LDFLLRYELRVDNGEWQKVNLTDFLKPRAKISAKPATAYNLEIKVLDYLGNSSSTLFATTTPAVPKPEYWVDNSLTAFTEVKGIQPPSYRAGQLIKIPYTAAVSSIKFNFNVQIGGGAFVKIFERDGGTGFATGTSVAVSNTQVVASGWLEFNFPTGPVLNADSSYWFVVYSDQYNQIIANIDVYNDGFYLNYQTDSSDNPPVQAAGALACTGGSACDLMFTLYDRRD